VTQLSAHAPHALDADRIQRAIAALGANPYVPPALERLKTSDVFDVDAGSMRPVAGRRVVLST
jgi:hypothetical protein